MAEFDLQHSVPIAGETIPCSSLSSWEIENTDTANSIFVNEQKAVPVASSAGGSEVAPGSTRTFFFDPAKNSLIGLRAATGAVLVNIRKETFRSRFLWSISRYASLRVAQADQVWQRVSATAVKLRGAFTEADVDLLKSKTFRATAGFIDLGTDTQVALVSPAGSTYSVVKDGRYEDTITNVLRRSLDAGGFYLQNTTPLIVLSGVSDTRVAADTNGVVLYTPAAGGLLSTSGLDIYIPIKNASVIAAGDIVEWVPNSDNQVQSAAAGSTNPQLGPAIAGGTGNVGLTVFARVRVRGVYVGLLASTAGVTAGHYGAAGITTANRLLSAAALSAASFCRILKTAASGVASTISVGLT